MWPKLAILAVCTALLPGALHAEGAAPTGKDVNGYHKGQAEATPGTAPAYNTGWNYIHPATCQLFDDGNGSLVLRVYGDASGVSGYWYTYDWQFQNNLQAVCGVGNWIGFWVTDTDGHWSGIAVYPYK